MSSQLQGWFLKLRRTHEGNSLARHVTKAWSKRYFVVVRDRIKWFKTADPFSGEKPCGFINFQEVLRIRTLHSESRLEDQFNRDEYGTYSLEIVANSRRLVIRTPSRDEAIQWVYALRKKMKLWTERTGVETLREVALQRKTVDTRDNLLTRIDKVLESVETDDKLPVTKYAFEFESKELEPDTSVSSIESDGHSSRKSRSSKSKTDSKRSSRRSNKASSSRHKSSSSRSSSCSPTDSGAFDANSLPSGSLDSTGETNTSKKKSSSKSERKSSRSNRASEKSLESSSSSKRRSATEKKSSSSKSSSKTSSSKERRTTQANNSDTIKSKSATCSIDSDVDDDKPIKPSKRQSSGHSSKTRRSITESRSTRSKALSDDNGCNDFGEHPESNQRRSSKKSSRKTSSRREAEDKVFESSNTIPVARRSIPAAMNCEDIAEEYIDGSWH